METSRSHPAHGVTSRSAYEARRSPAARARRDPGIRMEQLLQGDERSLLRFLTCGSVDDGKSTLIGRLLYDTQADPRGPARRAGARLAASIGTTGDDIDFALLVDGLEAEREQGITIDVAYRFFATATALIHRGRHAGPRAVHPQHGHGRLELRCGRHPDRRPQGRAARKRAGTATSARCWASATSSWR